MKDSLRFELKNVKNINEASIEINKINVIAGVNSSGKSTVSKIFYSFLKANSQDRKCFLRKELVDSLNSFITILNDKKIDDCHIPDKLTIKDGSQGIIEKYFEIIEMLKENNLYNDFKSTGPTMTKDTINYTEYLFDLFNQEDNCLLSEKIMYLILLNENFNEFLENESNSDFILTNKISDTEINFYNGFSNAFDYFFENEFINQVFYIDTVSILDFKENRQMPLHRLDLLDGLYLKYFKDLESLPDEVRDIYEKIEKIINGEYFPDMAFETKMLSDEKLSKTIKNNNDEKTLIWGDDNISSGFKQIGILQVLLRFKLKNNSYLIFDEPEVNLHPKWQFKFAEILVLLAKDLDITIYINSHSPTFIESIDAFAGFYDMDDDVNYYLTEEYGEKYNFVNIGSNELYKLYSNLGDVYNEINKLKIRKRLRNRG